MEKIINFFLKNNIRGYKMLIRIGSKFKVNDYDIQNNHLYIETNINPDFNILRKSG